MAKILHTKPLVDALTAQLEDVIPTLPCPPCLHVVLVGNDTASTLYVKRKQEAAARVGMGCTVHFLPEEISERDISVFIEGLNANTDVTGILLQLPLPAGMDTHAILNKINPVKDVDGLTEVSQRALRENAVGLRPATPLGVMRILNWAEVTIADAQAVVLGESDLVGMPVALMLMQAGAEVTSFNSGSDEDKKRRALLAADIIVSAAGVVNLVTADTVTAGVTVIDVGINRLEDGRITGDVAVEVRDIAGKVTPVPGGVGPMTVVSLLTNCVDAVCLQHNLPLTDW